MICVFSVLVNHLISFVSTGGAKSSGAAADGTSGALSKKVSEHAAGCKKNALKGSKQSYVRTACCGDHFDLRSPTGTRHCIGVNNPFFFNV